MNNPLIRDWQDHRRLPEPPPQGGGGGGGGKGKAKPKKKKTAAEEAIDSVFGNNEPANTSVQLEDDDEESAPPDPSKTEAKQPVAAEPKPPRHPKKASDWFSDRSGKFSNYSLNSFLRSQNASDIANGLTSEMYSDGSLDEAVSTAMKMASLLGNQQDKDPKRRVPINPMGSDTRKAITVAQSMIDRLCSEESDDPDLQNEFEFDPVKLMELKINPMRGLRSAMVGRKREPVGIFVDFSGSCEHVCNLFGLIMTGFAHEGGTLLIGGNGTIHFVYHPFEGAPLHRYAADFAKLTSIAMHARSSSSERVRVSAGYVVGVDSALSSFSGHLIACTDHDSYSELMSTKPGAHIIYCGFHANSQIMQAYFEGKRIRTTDPAVIQQVLKKHDRNYEIVWLKHAVDLALRHNVYMVNDLRTLTDALAKCR